MSEPVSFLDKYAVRPKERPNERPDGPAVGEPRDDLVESGLEDSCACFGWLRGARDRSVMLELRKKDGNIHAIGYAWIERVEYDPSIGITIHVLGRSIKITGRHLNTPQSGGVRLFDGIIRHRVTWVQEAGGQAGEHGGRSMAVAATIEW